MIKERLEKARDAYVAKVLECKYWQSPEIDNYILALVLRVSELESQIADLLSPDPRSKEPIMEVSDGGVETATATVNENVFLTREELAEPLATTGPRRIEINREPESFLNTSGMECTEKLGSLNGEKSGSHDVTEGTGSLEPHSLTNLISQIELDLINSFVQRERSITSAIDGTINAIIAEVNKQRIAVVSQFAATLRSKILRG